MATYLDIVAGSQQRKSTIYTSTGLSDSLDKIPATGADGFLDGSLFKVSVPPVPGGRLSLVSGDPAPSGDVTAATTIYYVPYQTSQLPLYVNIGSSGWRVHNFSQLSLSLAGLSVGVYDIYVYNNSSNNVNPNLTLQAVPWGYNASRGSGVGLSLQNGLWTLYGTSSKLLLGTIYINAAGQTEDSEANRLVCNLYNRMPRILRKFETANSWTYNSGGIWRPMNNNMANRCYVVAALDGSYLVDLSLSVRVDAAAGLYGANTINVDTTSLISNTFNSGVGAAIFGGSASTGTNSFRFVKYVGLGIHSFIAMETTSGSGSVTFWSSNSYGLAGTWMA